jgi:NADPH-dependent 2,4-dienoyl-CoA reductase/sulfur reductase-like enzyme
MENGMPRRGRARPVQRDNPRKKVENREEYFKKLAGDERVKVINNLPTNLVIKSEFPNFIISKNMSKIVIIGNGISGITAARHIRKNSDHEIVVISGESDHFFSRTALMYVYMGHMRFEDIKPYENWFWQKNRIDLVKDWVDDINYEKKVLTLRDKGAMKYDKLILALGSKPNYFGWPGQDLIGVQGLYSLQDLENLESLSPTTKSAVVVGGGLIGIELAEMLISRGIHVTFLVRDDSFWNGILPKEESALITRHIQKHHIDLRLKSELAEIIDDGKGRVGKIKTKTGEEITCQFVGLTAGVAPNIESIKQTGIRVKGGILVNHFLETSQPDVYAIGDCAEFEAPLPGRRPIEQVWYTGRIMGETVAQTICGNRMVYQPGPWFNSAKFFDIEYQTYGTVTAIAAENEADFYWEHKEKEKCIHVVWQQSTGKFLGINTFGIRMRHELFDHWLRAGVSIDEVMSNLRTANFDPEFFKTFEAEIIQKFSAETGRTVKLKTKTWWQKLLPSN